MTRLLLEETILINNVRVTTAFHLKDGQGEELHVSYFLFRFESQVGVL